jgi:hypothetical protein
MKKFPKALGKLFIILFFIASLGLSYSNQVGAQLVGQAKAQSAFGDPEVASTNDGASGLVAVEQDIEGGVIPVGSTAQVIVRFKNEGGRPIEFRDLNLYPSSTISAQTTINQCATEPLENGAECAIVLSIKGLQPGNWRVEMLVRHTGKSRLVTARIAGTVDAGDESANLVTDIEVLPTPVDFGVLEASRPIIQSVTIRNITANTININDMFIDAPSQSGYNLRTDCKVLNAGQACIASILWSPVIEGPSSGFLVVQHDGASAVTNVPLIGTFSPGVAEQAEVFPDALPGRGVLVSSETEVDFGSDINAQSAITLSLVNVGDTVLKMKNIQLAGSDNGLKLLQTGCKSGTELEPTEACPLTVSWAPTKKGAVIDDIQITHDGARGILVLPVRGTASEAISVDSKPIIITQDGGSAIISAPSAASDDTSSSGTATVAVSSSTPANLDGYIVTSHSSKHAIVRGPVGSRIVADGKTTIIGGFEWNVKITADGVQLTNANNAILLVFDRSLSNIGSSTGTSTAITGSVGAQ